MFREESKLDDVDIFVKNKRLSLEAESMSSMNTNTNTSTIAQISYWNSPEALKLFNPKKGEEVLDCLSRRIILLSVVSYDDDITYVAS